MQQLPRTHMPLRGPLRFVTNPPRVTCVPKDSDITHGKYLALLGNFFLLAS